MSGKLSFASAKASVTDFIRTATQTAPKQRNKPQAGTELPILAASRALPDQPPRSTTPPSIQATSELPATGAPLTRLVTGRLSPATASNSSSSSSSQPSSSRNISSSDADTEALDGFLVSDTGLTIVENWCDENLPTVNWDDCINHIKNHRFKEAKAMVSRVDLARNPLPVDGEALFKWSLRFDAKIAQFFLDNKLVNNTAVNNIICQACDAYNGSLDGDDIFNIIQRYPSILSRETFGKLFARAVRLCTTEQLQAVFSYGTKRNIWANFPNMLLDPIENAFQQLEHDPTTTPLQDNLEFLKIQCRKMLKRNTQEANINLLSEYIKKGTPRRNKKGGWALPNPVFASNGTKISSFFDFILEEMKPLSGTEKNKLMLGFGASLQNLNNELTIDSNLYADTLRSRLYNRKR